MMTQRYGVQIYSVHHLPPSGLYVVASETGMRDVPIAAVKLRGRDNCSPPSTMIATVGVEQVWDNGEPCGVGNVGEGKCPR